MSDDDGFQVENDSDNDSDKELQVAFEKGLLKDTVIVSTTNPKPKYINNKVGLEEALRNLKRDLPWQETLDICVEPAPLPYCLKDDDESDIKGDGKEEENDFKLENLFYRQAQNAVLKGLARLTAFNIPTKRPEDYFAEMLKSDLHMKKVKENILSLQAIKDKSEKAKKEREAKKVKKLADKEGRKEKKKEKLEYKNTLKKVRKKLNLGQRGKILNPDDLFEDTSDRKSVEVVYRKEQKIKQQHKQQQQMNNNKNNNDSSYIVPEKPMKANKKRMMKNKKFGFGGQKKRSKYNTRESVDEVQFKSFRSPAAIKKYKNKNKSNNRRNKKKK
ncbi:hypothetical protein HELRODRAFT_172051 [Helobdella robusta]|uniref:rRNA-processing protein EBP2 n=1 Tax=Helobdella robusta TaxID=6412 RepID=T1F4Z2_HELRO|nr:hypothetical protein HELRODRAFT_172051 [Helobdella robusta]ESO05038.1 hypothetical protein HELRODRAFT_172051 [Helobdella robusta]